MQERDEKVPSYAPQVYPDETRAQKRDWGPKGHNEEQAATQATLHKQKSTIVNAKFNFLNDET